MSKTSNRIVLIIGLLGVSFFAGCGVTSTSLPSSLPPGGGGALTIVNTQFPDAITGRAYNLVISTSGGSGILSSCTVVSGVLPTGLSWSTQSNTCILSGSAVGAAGTYSVVVQATDTSAPAKTTQLPYTLTVRNDFTICAGPSSALSVPYTTSCSATSSTGTITTFPTAVQGRSYGVSPLSQLVATNLVGGTTTLSVVGQTSEFGNGPFTSASSITGLPPGISSTPQSSQSNFLVSSTAVGAANTYTVTVSITDNPITVSTQTATVVPARTVSKTYTLIVNSPVSLAQSLGTAWPDAVSGRAYGSGANCTGGACAPAVYSITGGLGGAAWPATTPASIAAITGMSCAVVTTTYSCSAAKITAAPAVAGAAAVSYSPGFTVTDTANTATPAATAATDPNSTRTDTLWVDSPLLATLTQSGSTNPANLLQGVVGRSYGVISSGAAAPTYGATGGLGARTVADYGWCVSAGALPAGLGVVSANCASPTVPSAASLALTANPITTSANTYPFTLQLMDTGNASTPGSIASSTSATSATSLVVNPVLAVTITQSTNATPAASLLAGVVNRSYGSVPTTLATAAPPIYAATGGLPSLSGQYLWCVTAGSTLPPNLVGISNSCGQATSTSSSTVQLSASTASPIGGTGGSYSFTVQADDGGNAAVPSTFVAGAGDSMVGPTALTINPQIVLAQSLGAAWPDAVSGRAYGSPAGGPPVTGCSGGACQAAVYSATNGLGGYVWPGATPASISATGMSCSVVTTTYSCNAATITAAPTTAGAASVTYSPSATVSDTANAATPAATTTTDPASLRTDTLVVDAPISLTFDAALSSSPTTSFVAGVAGRDYGVAGDTCAGAVKCLPIVYEAKAGLGTYIFTPSAFPNAFVHAESANVRNQDVTSSFSAAPINAAAAGGYSPSVSVDDTANLTTPDATSSGTAPVPVGGTLTVNPKLTVAETDSLPSPLPAGVDSRPYGGTGFTPLQFTASGGLGDPTVAASYGFTPSGLPTNLTCPTPAAPNVNVLTCATQGAAVIASGASASSPYAATVAVNDVANTATPSASGSSTAPTPATNSLPIYAPLALSETDGLPTSPTLPAGVELRPYGGSGFTPLQYKASKGLGSASTAGSYVFTPSGFPTNLTCPAPTAPNADVLKCATQGAAVIPSGASGSSPYSLSVAVTDVANQTTPSASAVAGQAPTPIADTLPINAALTLTFDPALSSSADTSFKTGVAGRDYGVLADTCAGGPSTCKPIVYEAKNGLGTYTFTPSAFPNTFNHTESANVRNLDVTSSFFASPINASAATTVPVGYSPSVSVNDTANQTTPDATSASTAPSAVAGTLTVNPKLTLAETDLLPSPLPAGVELRPYGGTGFTPLQYTASGGLGDPTVAASYSFTPSNLPTNLTCPTPAAPNVNVLTCATQGAAVIAAGASASSPYAATVAVNDVANTATPSASGSSTAPTPITDSLPINAALTLTFDPALSSSADTSFKPGVAGRNYGDAADSCPLNVSGKCLPIVYEAKNGLGTYTFTPSGFPNTFSHTESANVRNLDVTSSFSASPINAAAAGGYSPSVSVDDTANQTTPDALGTTPSTAPSAVTGTLTVNAKLGLTDTYASAFPDAVVKRDYGVKADTCAGALSCAPIVFAATGGLPDGSGNYSFPASTPVSFPTGFSCTANSPATQYTCLANPVASSVTPGPFSPSVTVSDFANTAAPNGSTPDNGTLQVDAGVKVTLAIGGVPYTTSADWPVGVAGRPYGTGTCAGGASCVAPIYTATGGLVGTPGATGGYTFGDDSSLTTVGFACTLSSPTCPYSATNLSGTFTPSVTAIDVPNATTPASTLATPDATATFTTTNPVTVNSELQISNTFLENATVGEPYSASFSIIPGDVGLGGPYQWCLGTIANATCPVSPTGGITGVNFVTPSPAISDDLPQVAFGNLTNRGYYQGTPTTAETGTSTATTFQVSDLGNNTTPGCSYISPSTCPSFVLGAAHAPKVFASQGFVANSFAENLLPFDANTFAAGTSVDLSASAQTPITPRVTPDGQWVYVTAQSAISVVDPTSDKKAVPDITFTTAGTSTTTPTGLDVEMQMYFTGTPTPCTIAPCSNLAPYIRYDAWLVDPAALAASPLTPTASATVQPIPEAENPGMLPSALVSTNGLTVPYANSIALTPDAGQAWVSLAQNGGLIELDLPLLDPLLATSYPITSSTTFSNLGINGGAVAADPRYNLVYTLEMDQTNTYPYIAITTSGNPDLPLSGNTFIANLPTTAGFTVASTGTNQVCQGGGAPTGITVSPDGNRLFIACQNDPNSYVEAWDVSQSDGVLLGSDTIITPIATVNLPVSKDIASGGGLYAENGCATPLGIKAKLTGTTFGTRLFVSCHNSDTIVPVDYSTGSGTAIIDTSALHNVISTDKGTIPNAANPPYVNACPQAGSCPMGIDLMPNPALHFVTGGLAPASSPVAMMPATHNKPYYQYVTTAGGALGINWSNPDGLLGTGDCAGLSLDTGLGRITGTSALSGVTCGGASGFIIRVTDGTGQFVERAFTIPIN